MYVKVVKQEDNTAKILVRRDKFVSGDVEKWMEMYDMWKPATLEECGIPSSIPQNFNDVVKAFKDNGWCDIVRKLNPATGDTAIFVRKHYDG